MKPDGLANHDRRVALAAIVAVFIDAWARNAGRTRDRGYYTRKFTLSELRQMLRQAENRTTRDMYLIQEISAAITRKEWDEQ